jgi:hypothetical protein
MVAIAYLFSLITPPGHTHGKLQTPSNKLQTSTKHQGPNRKPPNCEASCLKHLELGICSLFKIWDLVFAGAAP